MRVCYVLLVASAALFASNNVVSGATTSEKSKLSMTVSRDEARAMDAVAMASTKRLLRSYETADEDSEDFKADEERTFDVSKLDEALKDSHIAKQLFKKWYKTDKLTPGQVAQGLEIDPNAFGSLQHKYVNLYLQYNARYTDKMNKHKVATN